jgi:hypothetical protein
MWLNEPQRGGEKKEPMRLDATKPHDVDRCGACSAGVCSAGRKDFF